MFFLWNWTSNDFDIWKLRRLTNHHHQQLCRCASWDNRCSSRKRCFFKSVYHLEPCGIQWSSLRTSMFLLHRNLRYINQEPDESVMFYQRVLPKHINLLTIWYHLFRLKCPLPPHGVPSRSVAWSSPRFQPDLSRQTSRFRPGLVASPRRVVHQHGLDGAATQDAAARAQQALQRFAAQS